nr:hypothetical protein [Tanacetum cinerariifolium]
THGEVLIAMQVPPEHLRQARHVAGFRNHPVADKALGHEAHLVGHPGGHEVRDVLFKSGRIVAPVNHRTTEHLRPDRGNTLPRQRVRPHQIDGFRGQLIARLIAT